MSNEILDDELHNQSSSDFSTVRFAKFWVRVGASVIDSLVFLPIIILGFYNALDWKFFPFEILTTCLLIIYKIVMEWKYQATLGKMAMKIKVVSEQLSPISLEQSIVRFSLFFMSYVGTLLAQYYLFSIPDFQSVHTIEDLATFQQAHQNSAFSWATVPIVVSAVMMAMDAKSQAIHDRMARTYCIYR